MIDIGASLNLLMRRTFIEMGLSLADLTPVQDTFHGIIPGQSSMPIGRIDLEVSCGSGENKRRETLTFEVASFDIGYNSILGRPFLLKFMAVIHTAYATIKMPGPKGVITITSDHRDAVACENATLTHAGKFGNKEAQDWAVKNGQNSAGKCSLQDSDAWISRRRRLPASHFDKGYHSGLPFKPASHQSADGRR
jgi:hypothetical protein